MGNHSRKKQKISNEPLAHPLGVPARFGDQEEKDEEELLLESFLFGPSDELVSVSSYKSNFVQDTTPDVEDHGQALLGRKSSAWTDTDDHSLQVSLAADKRRRKLRDALIEDTVDGREYERRLRREFEKENPSPGWARDARTLPFAGGEGKRIRTSMGSDVEEEEDPARGGEGLDYLLSQAASILETPHVKSLPHGTVAIERLRDANLSAKAEGEVKVVQFHPSPQVPILLAGSSDRRLRIFNIDGHTNPHLHTLHIPTLPFTNALFHPSGTSVLLTGPRPFYYTYDLQTGTTQRSPRGLWGTTFASNIQGSQDGSMEVCAFDQSGSVLAVAGRRGHVHLVDWRAGGGQVVGSVKMNAAAKSLWWLGEELLTLGDDSEIYVWNVGQRKCVRRWKDDGGYGSHMLGGDRSGKYLAIGSKVGFVNVYGADATHGGGGGGDRPKALKTIGNLTTAITSLRFNHDSQLLAIASNVKKDSMRLIHLPSLTAFSNWPTSSTPLGHVTSVDFSAGSEYVAIGIIFSS
ncbi:hypothetical protein GSI_06998 [Ganoderma sinense ZZ0214-1]|uniref:Uncharacterized protein n=1 Tax=Ganoderma sinense ZZ0214-1 TaxID=1077348 RepID=A0A2G8SAQ1_9APHY|nr:hypothetical protein GSI_06998 [Ganoderma sinense ZZ0214-1]